MLIASQLFNLQYEGLILLLAVCPNNQLLHCFLLLDLVTLLGSGTSSSTGFSLAGGAPLVLQVLVLVRDVLLILFQLEHVLHLELLEVLINVLHLVEVVVININYLFRDVIDLVNLSGVILAQKFLPLDLLLLLRVAIAISYPKRVLGDVAVGIGISYG